MNNLQQYIRESLLNDEEDLLSDHSITKEEVNKFLKSDEFNNSCELSDSYIEDKVNSGGLYKICPGKGTPWAFKSIKHLNKPVYNKFFKDFGIYDGDYYIYANIENWPAVLKIENPYSTHIFCKDKINQAQLPDLTVDCTINYLSSVSGLKLNCGRAFIGDINNTDKSVNINTFDKNEYKASYIYITDEKLRSWNQLVKIISNCKELDIYDTKLSKELISKYYKKSNKKRVFETPIDEPYLKKLIDSNFKNLEIIRLSTKKEEGCFISKVFNTWTFTYVK